MKTIRLYLFGLNNNNTRDIDVSDIIRIIADEEHDGQTFLVYTYLQKVPLRCTEILFL